MKKFLVLVIALLISACTQVQVRQVDPSHQMHHVCIEHNPKVIVAEFLPAVQNGFQRHGITTEVYNGVKPAHCEYHLTYTALKTWDMAMYLHHAELWLYQGVNQIGYAEYHLEGKGGLDLSKWASVEEKMDPVIDQLLSGYTPEDVDKYRKEIVTQDDASQPASKSDRLRELQSLYDEGLITEEELKDARVKILLE